MAQNCSSDVQAVIVHVDSVFTTGNQKEIDALKANWNLGNITHLDDVAGARKLFRKHRNNRSSHLFGQFVITSGIGRVFLLQAEAACFSTSVMHLK